LSSASLAFCFASSLGLSSPLGALPAVLALLRVPPLLRIVHDGGTIEQPALMVSVMNGRRMGGSFHMAPQSKNDDGVFTVCLAGQVSRLGIFLLIPKFIAGTQAGHPAIRYFDTAKLDVTALNGSLAAHADGETISTDAKSLSVAILPQAVEIIVGG